jgi:alanine racemase
MALVLTVRATQWRARIDQVVNRLGERLVPVVKGNGYGVGRPELADLVVELGLPEVAVGTVAELLPHALVQHVLTPSLDDHLDALPPSTILTVGSLPQAAAANHAGPIALKLQSSMRRYGVAPADLPGVLDALTERGRAPARFVLHLPLAGSDDDRIAEVEAWLRSLPAAVPISLSHLAVDRFEQLADRHPARSFQLRLGTALWHGDKSDFHLGAEVVDRRRMAAGDRAGYRLASAPADGDLVMIAAGSAHGVHPLVDGRSPFHFERTRLALLEPPHMHTSMAFVPLGDPCPAIGQVVDVQRPLTQVHPDRTVWIR